MRSTVAGVGTSDSPPAAEVCGDSCVEEGLSVFSATAQVSPVACDRDDARGATDRRVYRTCPTYGKWGNTCVPA
jgi:hypothetical protein